MTGTTVCIPVGPSQANRQWLDEAVESVHTQTYTPDELLLIDDGAGIVHGGYGPWVSVWRCPWRTGISHAFNYGVALAQHECVFMLGSDDTLEPTCLERCLEAYERMDRRDAYYSVAVRYMDDGVVQTSPCNAAMVTKGFWKMTGGFPIESSVGCGDSMLLSICLAHQLPVYEVGYVLGEQDDHIIPLYNYRRHDGTWTASLSHRQDIIHRVRDEVTRDWTPGVKGSYA